MIQLKNKKILITGASSGIGKSIALMCSKLGAKTILIGRKEEEIKKVINSMDNPTYHSYLIADIKEHSELEIKLKQKIHDFGPRDSRST